MSGRSPKSGLLVALACIAALVAGCGSTAQVSGTASAGGDGLRAEPGLSSTSQPPGSGDIGGGGGGTTAVGSVGTPTGADAVMGGISQAGPSAAANGRRPGSPSAIPAKGFGWDTTSVYVGIPTEEDVHQYAGSLGINFDPGSLEEDAKAVIADVNAKGGLFGRRVVPVFHDNATSDLESNPQAAAQRNCTAFTEDHQVIAVFNAVPTLDTDNWHACLQSHHTPLVNGSSSLYDSISFKQFGPYLWNTIEPNMSVFAPRWVSELKRLAYFSKWNTTAGGPGSAAVKVGILMPDAAVSQRIAREMKDRLVRLGLPVVEYAYHDSVSNYGGDMSSAVLRFASSGVTHVLSLPPIALAKVVFMQTAEQQRYRPRYAMSSVDNPLAFVSNVPKEQLSGGLGVGWIPAVDVDTAHDPGQTAPQRECLTALKRGGQTFAGDTRRVAMMAAFDICTSLKLIVAAGESAQGFDAQHLARGIGSIGFGFPTAPTFHSGLSPTNPAMPDQVRTLAYSPQCGCFTYQGEVHAY